MKLRECFLKSVLQVIMFGIPFLGIPAIINIYRGIDIDIERILSFMIGFGIAIVIITILRYYNLYK